MNYPKIGIRPVIDGRWGGVRESLEKQTMNMAAKAAAAAKAEEKPEKPSKKASKEALAV